MSHDQRTEDILDGLDDMFAADENLSTIAVAFGAGGRDRVVIEARDPGRVERASIEAHAHGLPVDISAGDPPEPSVIPLEDAPDLSAYDIKDSQIGQGGVHLVGPGGVGTLCLTLAGMTIEMRKGNTLLQRCHRSGATLIACAHFLKPNGETLRTGSKAVGTTSCSFDLDMRDTLDYGHGDWTHNVKPVNYARVYDPASETGRKVVAVAEPRRGMNISMQGATSGWQSGSVTARVTTRLSGYRGNFRCWRGSYAMASGDSGAPILTPNGADWTWVGMQFATRSHFWSWTDVGARQQVSVLAPGLAG